MKSLILLIFFLYAFQAFTQTATFNDSILRFRKEYVENHEVVTDPAIRKHFQFFAPDSRFRVIATFTPVPDTSGIDMITYSRKKKAFLIYGYADFKIRKKPYRLYIYRYRKLMNDPIHKDDLFLPFTDKTCGKKSYVCRYLDLKIGDIKNNLINIDFNKCYNPYCAYKDGFNCPIPPRENHLPIAINAGEQAFPQPYRQGHESAH